MPARIEDVAATAGVSMKTVSRVFNREPNVSEKMRLRVEAAAKALNYRPNPSARSLAGNRSYLISLVYDDPAAGSSYIMEIIVGMLAACEHTHYSAMLRPLEYSSADHVGAVEESVAQYRPDGLILVPPFADDPWDALLGAVAPRMNAGGFVYAEAGRSLAPPSGWELVRHARAGGVHYHLLAINEAAPRA